MKLFKTFVVIISTIIIFLTACTKETNTISKIVTSDTIRITIHDTLKIHDTLRVNDTVFTKTQLLTRNSWNVDFVSHVITNQYSYYDYSGSNTTGIPYQNLKFTFKADGTGTNTNQSGTTYQLTWILSSDQKTMMITLADGYSTAYTWLMFEVTKQYLYGSVNLTISGSSNNMESFRLKPGN